MEERIGLITQVMRLKDAFPETADKLAADLSIEGEPLFVRKGIVPSEVNFEDGERASWDYITTGAIDRDNEIVDPAGGMFDDYMKNPVVLFGHDHRSMPIGMCVDIRIGKSNIAAKTVYANTAQANEVYEYRKAGFPMAKSIGFIPLKTTRFDPESDEGKQGISRRYDKWLLLEYSDVPVPSNPEALQIAISKGLLTADESLVYGSESKGIEFEVKEVIEKPGWDETDEMFRFRVRDPGLFRDGTFRTVPIQRTKPRVNSVMGKLKKNEGAEEDPMTVQNLMFPKEDEWTLDAAKAWKEAHGDLLKMYEYILTLDLSGITTSAIHNETEEKSGRVLSAKNRAVINAAVEAMDKAKAALDELLAATEQVMEEGVEGQEFIRIDAPRGKEKMFFTITDSATDTFKTVEISANKILEEGIETSIKI